MPGQRLVASCQCGQVRIEVEAAPILSAICHCDDCQAAARELEALPGAPRILDDYHGTPLTLVPPDRMQVVRGAELLSPHKLRQDSPTNRRVATCCNSLMSLDFDRGPFWASLITNRIEDPKPAPVIRVQTEHVPEGVTLPDTPPSSKGYGSTTFLRILGAGASMLARKIFKPR